MNPKYSINSTVLASPADLRGGSVRGTVIDYVEQTGHYIVETFEGDLWQCTENELEAS